MMMMMIVAEYPLTPTVMIVTQLVILVIRISIT